MSRRIGPKRAAVLAGCLLGTALLTGVLAPASADPPEGGKAQKAPESAPKTRTLGVFLYPNFELLDVCGPVEIFGNTRPRVKVVTVAAKAGPVASVQGTKLVADYGLDDCPDLDLVLVPGGRGTLDELKNVQTHDWLRKRAAKAEIVMSVCTGSAILAKAGLLDDRRATCNKQYFSLFTGQAPKVKWVKEARWVDDGNRVTSSGVSAGMDMALHVVARLFGDELAGKIADGTEYQWHKDADKDPFAKFAK
jgi:transcriptional regulator GlxA family with amidase domain